MHQVTEAPAAAWVPNRWQEQISIRLVNGPLPLRACLMAGLQHGGCRMGHHQRFELHLVCHSR